jgi:hypothetical protein
MRFAQCIHRTLALLDADPARKQIDADFNAPWEKLIGSYEGGMQKALRCIQS